MESFIGFTIVSPPNKNKNKNNNCFKIIFPSETHTYTHLQNKTTASRFAIAAINNHLSRECTFILTTVAPELMEYPKNQLTIEGSNVTFSCIAGGVPSPRISWTINGTAINVMLIRESI